MSVFKPIESAYITSTPFYAHKLWTITSSSPISLLNGDANYIDPDVSMSIYYGKYYTSSWVSSSYEDKTSNGKFIRNIWNSAQHLYYRDFYSGYNRIDAEGELGIETRNITDTVQVYSFPKNVIGDQIQRGTFKLVSGDITLVDDGNGNIIRHYSASSYETIVDQVYIEVTDPNKYLKFTDTVNNINVYATSSLMTLDRETNVYKTNVGGYTISSAIYKPYPPNIMTISESNGTILIGTTSSIAGNTVFLSQLLWNIVSITSGQMSIGNGFYTATGDSYTAGTIGISSSVTYKTTYVGPIASDLFYYTLNFNEGYTTEPFSYSIQLGPAVADTIYSCSYVNSINFYGEGTLGSEFEYTDIGAIVSTPQTNPSRLLATGYNLYLSNYGPSSPYYPIFNGTSSYISIPHTDLLNFDTNQDFSLGVWVRFYTGSVGIDEQLITDTTGSSIIVAKDFKHNVKRLLRENQGETIVYENYYGAYPYKLEKINSGYSNTGKIRFSRFDGNTYTQVTSSVAIPNDTWVYVIARKSGSNVNLRIVSKGSLLADDANVTDTCLTKTKNDADIFIGGSTDLGADSGAYLGRLGSIHIFDRCISTSELSTLSSTWPTKYINNYESGSQWSPYYNHYGNIFYKQGIVVLTDGRPDPIEASLIHNNNVTSLTAFGTTVFGIPAPASAQSFLSPSDWITSVGVKPATTQGTYTGSVYLGIWEDTGADTPDSQSILYSKIISISDWDASSGTKLAFPTSIPVISGNKYWIVLSGSGVASNNPRVATTGAPHTGSYKQLVGSPYLTWGAAQSKTMCYWIESAASESKFARPYVDFDSIEFRSTKLINSNEVICTVGASDLNMTTNPSILDRRASTCQPGTGGNNIPNNDSECYPFVTASFFSPYVTTIGLYNDAGELLVVGKLGFPVQKSTNMDTNFIVRWDLSGVVSH